MQLLGCIDSSTNPCCALHSSTSSMISIKVLYVIPLFSVLIFQSRGNGSSLDVVGVRGWGRGFSVRSTNQGGMLLGQVSVMVGQVWETAKVLLIDRVCCWDMARRHIFRKFFCKFGFSNFPSLSIFPKEKKSILNLLLRSTLLTYVASSFINTAGYQDKLDPRA